MRNLVRLSFCIVSLLWILSFPHASWANEGTFSLKQNSIRCEGISVWQDQAYRISGKCSGLVYPYHDQYSGYALWVQPDDGGTLVRIGNITRGILSGSIEKHFTGLLITAEKSVDPKTPSSYQIISGNLTLFQFPLPYQTQTNTQVVSQNQTQAGSEKVQTPTPTKNPPIMTTSSLGLNKGTVVVLVVIGVIIMVIFGIFSFIKR